MAFLEISPDIKLDGEEGGVSYSLPPDQAEAYQTRLQELSNQGMKSEAALNQAGKEFGLTADSYVELSPDAKLDEPPSQLLTDAERTLKGMVGLGETAGAFGSGLVGQGAAGVVGLRQILAGRPPEEVTREMGRIGEALTYKPQTEAGKQFTGGLEWGMGKVAEAGKFAGEKVQDLLSRNRWTRPLANIGATAADVAVQTAAMAPLGVLRRGKPMIGPRELGVSPLEVLPEETVGKIPPTPEVPLSRQLPPGPRPMIEPPSSEWVDVTPQPATELAPGPQTRALLPTGQKLLPEGGGKSFLTTKQGTVEVQWNPGRNRFEAVPAPEIISHGEMAIRNEELRALADPLVNGTEEQQAATLGKIKDLMDSGTTADEITHNVNNELIKIASENASKGGDIATELNKAKDAGQKVLRAVNGIPEPKKRAAVPKENLNFFDEPTASTAELTLVKDFAGVPGSAYFFNRLKSGKEGMGGGTKVLKQALEESDRSGIPIINEVKAYGGLSQDQLIAFYKKHGFERFSPEGGDNALIYRPKKETPNPPIAEPSKGETIPSKGETIPKTFPIELEGLAKSLAAIDNEVAANPKLEPYAAQTGITNAYNFFKIPADAPKRLDTLKAKLAEFGFTGKASLDDLKKAFLKAHTTEEPGFFKKLSEERGSFSLKPTGADDIISALQSKGIETGDIRQNEGGTIRVPLLFKKEEIGGIKIKRVGDELVVSAIGRYERQGDKGKGIPTQALKALMDSGIPVRVTNAERAGGFYNNLGFKKKGTDYIFNKLKIGEEPVSSALSREEANSILQEELSGLKNAPKVRIVDSPNEIPGENRPEIAGVYRPWDKSVWVNRSNIHGPEDFRKILRHEVIGHYATEAMMGNDLDPFMGRVFSQYGESGLEDIAQTYGFDLGTAEGRLKAAKEKIARIAETNEDPGLLKQFYAFVREALNKLSGGKWFKDISDSEIQSAISRAAKEMREGKFTQESTMNINGKPYTAAEIKAKAERGESQFRLNEAGFLEIPTEDIKRAYDRFKEFWKPLSTLPHREEILAARGKALGGVARVESIVNKTWNRLKDLPDASKEDIFKGMSGQKDMYDLSPADRHTAQHFLNLNDIIGEMLVKRGILTVDQFNAHKGQYIRYMYLKHVLGEDAKIPTRPNGKLDLSYQKSRQDLTWEQRRALGIIENASIAEPLGMAKSLSDIVKFDFLEKIASDPRNVWKPSIVEVKDLPKEFTERGAKAEATIQSRLNGDKFSAVHMAKDRWIVWSRDTGTAVGRKMGIGELVDEVNIYKKMAREMPGNIEIQSRLNSMETALEKAKEATGKVPADFVQMPTSKHWGPLAGAFVRKPIALDLMGFWGEEKGNIQGLSGAIEKMARLDEKLTGAFKIAKVPLNLPTSSRNIVSNVIQLGMSGMPLWRIPDFAISGIQHMINKTPEWGQAYRNGLFKTNWSVAELNEVMSAFRKMQGDTWGGIVGKMQDMAKWYGKIDDLFKMAKYLEQREQGLPVEKAVIEAQKWGMDYSLADPSVKWARRHFIPFASYQYKIAPLVVESAIRRPWVIGSLLALPYMVWEAAKAMNKDMTEEDWQELRKSIPTDVKESGTWMLVPVKVGGKWRWFNYSYMLPWGNIQQGAQAVKESNIKAAVVQSGAFGTPLTQLVKTFGVAPLTNDPPKEPFSNQPIYNRLDPPYLKAGKTMEFFYNMFAPSMLTRYGAIGYTASIGKEDRWGRTIDLQQAIPRWFGVNLVEANPKVSGVALKAQINALRDEFIKIQADPNISPERKDKYRQRLLEEINDLLQKRNQ